MLEQLRGASGGVLHYRAKDSVQKCSLDICDRKNWERWLIEVSASGSREKKQNDVKPARKRTQALVKGSPRQRLQEP